MKRLCLLFIVLAAVPGACAQPKSDSADLTRLLTEFLAGASRNDAATHERFWADGPPAAVNKAEDIRIHQYGIPPSSPFA